MRSTVPSKHHILSTVVVGAITSLAFTACSPVKNKVTDIPKPEFTQTEKPSRITSTRVAQTALGELSYIERALKPFFGIAMPAGNCRSTTTTDKAQWQTTWKCDDDPKVRGRKEILGVERLNYDHSTRTLSYKADFETRTFSDLEPRAKAHLLTNSRRITIRFDKNPSDVSSSASITMTSLTSVGEADSTRVPGSNFGLRLLGKLVRQDSVWNLTKDSEVKFDGILYGVDGERGTRWASGKFTFLPEAPILLTGLNQFACTAPIGSWHVFAEGGGHSYDAVVDSTDIGVSIAGPPLEWIYSRCERP